jgi:hypothetical protein
MSVRFDSYFFGCTSSATTSATLKQHKKEFHI